MMDAALAISLKLAGLAGAFAFWLVLEKVAG
jgi:hypothetical protein